MKDVAIDALGMDLHQEGLVGTDVPLHLPVRALSKVIRVKFKVALEKAFRRGRLRGKIQGLQGSVKFQLFSRKLKRIKWDVFPG